MRSSWFAWMAVGVVALGALVLSPASASAQGGYGWGAGPSFVFSGDSFSLGWEAGGATAFTLVKLNAGGSYRLSGGEGEPRAVHYLAYEPWLFVGGTVGVALADRDLRFMAGLWEGFPLPVQGAFFGGDNSDDLHPQAWLFTFAFGVRFFGGHTHYYVTPKLWRYATIELNS